MNKIIKSKSAIKSYINKQFSDSYTFCSDIKKKKRVGRGIGSGLGKTSTRGHKGAGARSGKKTCAHYSQNIFIALPKRGFSAINYSNIVKKTLTLIDLFNLVKKNNIPSDTLIDLEYLKKIHFIKSNVNFIKIIDTKLFDFNIKINLALDSCSEGAIKKLEKSGSAFKFNNK